jgi:hypothetical protein
VSVTTSETSLIAEPANQQARNLPLMRHPIDGELRHPEEFGHLCQRQIDR